MKIPILLSAIALVSVARAEFATWTNKDGRSAELEIVEVTETDGGKTGVFRMRNGTKVRIAAADLTEEDAARLSAWKSPAEAAGAPASVFDDSLDGKLLALSGKSLKKLKDFEKPTKYYLFYYTASWCGPCQRFTPSLVEFYNKRKNEEFEIILITSDRDEDAMEEYARQKKMPWPHLRLREVQDFKEEFAHPGGGIPNLVLTDLEGNLLKTSYQGSNYTGPTPVMNHLGELLK